ncbi:MAG: hypothetical protein M1839_007636 [Geoglossum umbratile]|nr:MAG: hypothetical protein M1839_007636 [Geoglossum umbratile]
MIGLQSELSIEVDNTDLQGKRYLDACTHLGTDPGAPTIDRLKLILEPYQVIGVSWMQKMEEGPLGGGILADFPGAGESVQAVGLIVHSRDKWAKGGRQDAPKPTLIVYPASVADEWFLKTGEHAPTLRIFHYHGGSEQLTTRSRVFDGLDPNNESTIVLASYEFWGAKHPGAPIWGTSNDEEFEVEDNRDQRGVLTGLFHGVICDEGHKLKGESHLARASAGISTPPRPCLIELETWLDCWNFFDGRSKDSTTYNNWVIQVKNKLRGNSDSYPTEDLKIIYAAGRISGDALALISPRLDTNSLGGLDSYVDSGAELAPVTALSFKRHVLRHLENANGKTFKLGVQRLQELLEMITLARTAHSSVPEAVEYAYSAGRNASELVSEDIPGVEVKTLEVEFNAEEWVFWSTPAALLWECLYEDVMATKSSTKVKRMNMAVHRKPSITSTNPLLLAAITNTEPDWKAKDGREEDHQENANIQLPDESAMEF